MQPQLSRISALNKSGWEAWFAAAQILVDGAEKMGRLQFATFKSLVRESTERGRSWDGVKSFTDLPGQTSSEVVATVEKVLGYTRNIYDTAHEAGVQLFDLSQRRADELRETWFAALDDLTEASPGGATGGTKAALASTKSSVEAVMHGLTRSAKQSMELADAMVKTTSDSATQAIKAIVAHG